MSETGDLLNPPKEKEAAQTPATPPTPAEVKAMAKPSAKPALGKNMLGTHRSTISTALQAYGDWAVGAHPSHAADFKRQLIIMADAIASDPKKAECTSVSIIGAVLRGAMTGLAYDLRDFYLVPYGAKQPDGSYVQELQFMMSYMGMCKLVLNAGICKTICANVVYENDIFDCEMGTGERITHRRDWKKPRGKAIAVYAKAVMANGSETFEIDGVDGIDEIRKRNSMQKNGPKGAWVTDWDEMAKKVMLKRLAKRLPMSSTANASMFADGYVVHAKPLAEISSDAPDEMFVKAEYVEDGE